MPKKQGDAICKNCGSVGHIYKQCPHPTTSIGIICRDMKTSKYLMIQRKYTLRFMEFIKGNYDPHNPEYVCGLIMNMENREKEMIKHMGSFKDLWTYVWSNSNNNAKDFDVSNKNFSILMKDPKMTLFIRNINTDTNNMIEAEWGFPKGRKKMKETDIDCACREFFEETQISLNNIKLITDYGKFEEIFYGTNGVLYRHLYFLAEYIGDNIEIHINKESQTQMKEIRDIQWFSNTEVIKHLKEYNIERIAMFKRLDYLLS
tara:strand:- start:1491 stop:2270 length:780 start_codon:yes stop_codon:yes gene_type:complete